MKLKSIDVTNFKSCRNGTINLDKVNVFIGPNGRGKTSAENALRYLLNGKLPVDPIRHGEDHLSVTGIIDDGQNTEIGRFCYLPDTFRINGADVKKPSFVKEVEKYKNLHETNGYSLTFGSSTNTYFPYAEEKKAWEFLLNGKVEGARMYGIKELEAECFDGTTFYIRLSQASKVTVNGRKVTGKALAELLRDRLQGDEKALDIVTSSATMNAMEMPDFAKYLISVVPMKVDFNKLSQLANLTQEESDLLKDYFPPVPEAITTTDITEAYKRLFAERTEIGRTLDELTKKSRFSGMMPLPDKGTFSAELDTLKKELGGAAQIEKAWTVYNKALEEYLKAVEVLEKWKAELASMDSVTKPDVSLLEDLRKREESLAGAIEQDTVTASRLEEACRPIERMIASLDTTVCPLCDTLVCKTDKTQCKNDLERSVITNKSLITEAEGRIADARKALEEVKVKVEELHSMELKWNEKENLAGKIEALSKTMHGVPDMPAKIPDVANIQKRIEVLSRNLEEITIYEECIKSKGMAEEVRKRYDLFTSVVKKSEPKKGLLTNTILEYVLTPFCNHANGFLNGITGDMELSFRMDDDGLQVYCCPHGKSFFVPVKALSTGEKLLVSFALMDMVSTISNSRILVFDCLEELDIKMIEALMDMVIRQDILDRYDHIILSMVNHEDIERAVERKAGLVNIVRF